jgi:IS1 family transposase
MESAIFAKLILMLDNKPAAAYSLDMNRLPMETRVRILGALVEGMSMRATSRLCDVSINTVTKLLLDVGRACAKYQDEKLRDLPLKRLECDEIWSFVGVKEKNRRVDDFGFGRGDVWTWTAIDAETKLVPCWLVGPRNGDAALDFMTDLAARLRHRVQITTDGHRVYVDAIEQAFGSNVDYAMLVKVYGVPPEAESRYSPAECIGCHDQVISGDPDYRHISTSYAERQNLTMRMSMRRFTRLTNAFSKKVENHAAAVALYFMHYNFARIHKTLRVTPAMEARVSDHLWTLEDIARLAN